jgi:hypothetical protein
MRTRYFGMAMAPTSCTKSLQKILRTSTSPLVMSFDSKKPACLGLQDLSQNANVVTPPKPNSHPHPKRRLSGMSGGGSLPVVFLMARAGSMVAPWRNPSEAMVPQLKWMEPCWKFGTSARPVMPGPKFHMGLLLSRKRIPSNQVFCLCIFVLERMYQACFVGG